MTLLPSGERQKSLLQFKVSPLFLTCCILLWYSIRIHTARHRLNLTVWLSPNYVLWPGLITVAVILRTSKTKMKLEITLIRKLDLGIKGIDEIFTVPSWLYLPQNSLSPNPAIIDWSHLWNVQFPKNKAHSFIRSSSFNTSPLLSQLPFHPLLWVADTPLSASDQTAPGPLCPGLQALQGVPSSPGWNSPSPSVQIQWSNL